MMRGRGRWRRRCWGNYQNQFLVAFTGIRWAILRAIGNGQKSTSEIYSELVASYGDMPRSLLYYHLGELEKMGIIEVVGYRETGKGGAPEKIWRVAVRRIVIDILSGQILMER